MGRDGDRDNGWSFGTGIGQMGEVGKHVFGCDKFNFCLLATMQRVSVGHWPFFTGLIVFGGGSKSVSSCSREEKGFNFTAIWTLHTRICIISLLSA